MHRVEISPESPAPLIATLEDNLPTKGVATKAVDEPRSCATRHRLSKIYCVNKDLCIAKTRSVAPREKPVGGDVAQQEDACCNRNHPAFHRPNEKELSHRSGSEAAHRLEIQ